MSYHFKRSGPRLMATAALSLVLGAVAAQADIRFWTTETQPARLERQEKMAADFQAASGIAVEVIPVEEKDLGTRATAAFAAGDLPDVIYHPLQYALPWTEAGILDPEAANEVVEKLGKGTFAPGPGQRILQRMIDHVRQITCGKGRRGAGAKIGLGHRNDLHGVAG